MLQDIYPHILDISFKAGQTPDERSLIVHFKDNTFFCKKREDGALLLPAYAVYPRKDPELVYLFELDTRKVFLDLGEEKLSSEGYSYENINIFRSAAPKELLFTVMTAYHLNVWHFDNRYCGRCGTKTVHDDKERMLRCPKCGHTIYPRIMPSVIVGVRNGDSLLLTRYNRPGARLSALVAGFCEIGETGEDTVRREVLEETRLKVKNIRYYKSQPWGITAGGLLLGYWCDVEDESEICVDGEELAEAVWVNREDLKEYISDSYSTLTAEMIGVFASGEY